MRTLPAVSIFVAILALSSRGYGQSSRHDVRVELGGEYDTNPKRVEQLSGLPVVEGSGAVRVVATFGYAALLAERWSLSLSGGLGGRWLENSAASGEDMFTVQSQDYLAYQASPRLNFQLGGGYYDAYQRGRDEARDFRSVAPALRMDGRVGEGLHLIGGVGTRFFTFKSNSDFSFWAPTALLGLRRSLPGDVFTGSADWEWSVQATAEWRGYKGQACSATQCGPHRHRAFFGVGQVEVARVGSMLWGAGGAVHVNRSNTFGESLVRGLCYVRTAMGLPLDLTVSARVEALLTHYQERVSLTTPIVGATNTTVEDENRSTLRLELSRMLHDFIEIGARYTFYSSVLSQGGMDYQRHTFLLYLAASSDS